MGLQRHTRPKLNAAAEAAGAAHDATTGNIIEQILADEEQHLSWLDTEIAQRAANRSGGRGAEAGVERLFEAFYTTKSGGMGIGLLVSRSIIESHRGQLGGVPNEGPGATFWFHIA